MEVLELADYIGSTSGIIQYATKSPDKEFLICTELGVLFELRQKNPDKSFYSVGHRQYCPNMKKITLKKIVQCLETMSPTVEIEEEKRVAANIPLNRMLELAE
jgi:quinolinate synthase